jgi:hypothetical protein
MAPKNPLRENDHWGVGERADGSINVMTEDEARIARMKRDAEDEVFGASIEGEDPDDISDL